MEFWQKILQKFRCDVSTSQRGDWMGKVVHLKDFQWQKSFNQDIIPFFRDLNVMCQYFRHEKEGVCVAKTDTYLFIFLTYIDKNEHTALPSLMDRFYDIKQRPRTSKGEWVVEHIYQVEEKHTKKLVERLERYKGDPKAIIDLKNNLKQ